MTFFISCDSDSEITTLSHANRAIFNRNATELPGNIENPYDERVGFIMNFSNRIMPVEISRQLLSEL